MSLRHRLYFWLLFVGLLLTACAQAAPSSTETPANTPSATRGDLLSELAGDPLDIDIDQIPAVDTSKAIVPLEEIYFDTFRQYDRVVPLPLADDALIKRLRDAIPPIYEPKFETADSARWLSNKNLVLGYAQGDIAIAYPIKVLNWHEIVSHDVDGVPIAATY